MTGPQADIPGNGNEGKVCDCSWKEYEWLRPISHFGTDSTWHLYRGCLGLGSSRSHHAPLRRRIWGRITTKPSTHHHEDHSPDFR